MNGWRYQVLSQLAHVQSNIELRALHINFLKIVERTGSDCARDHIMLKPYRNGSLLLLRHLD
jgi:hypothetical protein